MGEGIKENKTLPCGLNYKHSGWSEEEFIALTTEDMELLISFSQNDDKWIRASVLQNSICTAEMICKMADDPEWVVRRACAVNSKCPDEILQKLLNDDNRWVSRDAYWSLWARN